MNKEISYIINAIIEFNEVLKKAAASGLIVNIHQSDNTVNIRAVIKNMSSSKRKGQGVHSIETYTVKPTDYDWDLDLNNAEKTRLEQNLKQEKEQINVNAQWVKNCLSNKS